MTGRPSAWCREIADVEVIVTGTPTEALILECNLIKKHRPRYNVMLKDDKSYPYIRLTRKKHPRLEVTRKKKDGSRYFGPYPTPGRHSRRRSSSTSCIPCASAKPCRNGPASITIWANAWLPASLTWIRASRGDRPGGRPLFERRLPGCGGGLAKENGGGRGEAGF